ncbi:hypothetical protein QIT82_gp56 [Pseudomonas phage psageK9]|uniref:Uncharacterized protein n=1 Tax=Pseudomonas phage psageK9 TaxID=2875722 RepID=A0AAE9BT21_9CAUD|nr:hypothetical protein [Pseudomonas syringae]YP_010773262.1 hypothetical protein QIT82_gp56 [Pseudomonas phage psageK9]MDG6439125.1 hypothetical protein [Pseudomonas syringae pv. actinidiae]QXV71630.1 hypothetical protein psageB2_053 [Pseudomonas phage psageB2]UAW53926.1 hypothetical protein psageK9_56 [Pseudomonas phage psageK9]
MTVDIEKLEALAEAAIDQEKRWKDAGEPWPIWNKCLLEMQAAANPAAVLELIAELKQAGEDNVTWKGGISALGEALKKLTFCARTVTDGPDQALMAACDAAENALSLGGVSRAIDYIEGLKAENKELLEKYEAARDRQNSITALKAENAGLKTGYEAYERVNAELRAERKALRKDASLHSQLQRAAEVLPGAWSVEIVVEHHAGWIDVFDDGGNKVMFDGEGHLADQVSDAIDLALTLSKEDSQ